MIIIGIAGGTGSGKTTLSDRIKEQIGENVTVLKHDNYYHAHVGMSYEERAAINYDCPDALETELLIEHVRALRRGETIVCPVYDYTVHNRSPRTITVTPSPVIVIEGILALENRELCSLMDIKIFVDTDADVRIIRRIMRDTRERARSLDSVVAQYLQTVKPMHEQYCEPSRKNADIIVPEGGKNEVALDMIIIRIKNYLGI